MNLNFIIGTILQRALQMVALQARKRIVFSYELIFIILTHASQYFVRIQFQPSISFTLDVNQAAKDRMSWSNLVFPRLSYVRLKKRAKFDKTYAILCLLGDV